MPNMSYCRFENTDSDLADCENKLQGMIEEGGHGKLSDSELRAAKSLLERCARIVRMVAEAGRSMSEAALDADIPDDDLDVVGDLGDKVLERVNDSQDEQI